MDAIVPKDWKIEKLAEGFGWAEGPDLGEVRRLSAVHRRARQQDVEVVGERRPREIPRSFRRREPRPERLARSRRQRPRHPRQEAASCWPTPAAAASRSLDLATKKKTPVAIAVRRQEVLEPERRGAHEERRGVLHRSAVRLQEVRRGAGEGDQPFNGVYRVGKDGKVTAIEKELHRPNGVALSPDETHAVRDAVGAHQGHHHGVFARRRRQRHRQEAVPGLHGPGRRRSRRDCPMASRWPATARSSPAAPAACSCCRRTASAWAASATARPPPTASSATTARRCT